MKYIETYSDARSPPRRLWNNLPEAVRDVEKFGQFSNVSISIWWYKDAEKKYFGKGIKRRFLRMGAAYSTAITNKLFFDIDCVDTKGNIIQDRIDRFHNMWRWIIENNFRRQITFTGGGYQAIISCNIRAQNYEGVYWNIKDKFGIVDEEYPTLEKMRRVPGSYNFGKDKKSKRYKYCICLRDNEVFLPFNKLLELSEKPRSDIIWTGEHEYIPKNTKYTPKRKKLNKNTSFTVNNGVNEILSSYGWEYNDICECIRNIIEQSSVRHHERMEIIKYLKSIVGLKYADCMLILPKIMTSPHGSGNDGDHSIEEGQPDSIYSRNTQFNPDAMIKRGYCDHGCEKCKRFIKNSR